MITNLFADSLLLDITYIRRKGCKNKILIYQGHITVKENLQLTRNQKLEKVETFVITKV